MSAVAIPPLAANERGTEHPHITRIEGVRDGAPVLRGTHIPVRLIAQMYRMGDSVEDILQSYPQLTATSVHDAISYYLDHRAEIETEIVEQGIENVLIEVGGHMDTHGFITFTPAHG